MRRAHPVSAVLIAIFAGIPLAIAPRIFLGYATTPKLAVAFLGTACLLLLSRHWVPGLVALFAAPTGRLYLGLLLAELASLLLSTAFSSDWQLSLVGTTSRRFGALNQAVIVFLTAVAAGHLTLCRPFAQKLIVAIEIVGGLAGFYGISQYFGCDPLLPPDSYTSLSTAFVTRIPSTFGHAMIFASFLVPVVFIASLSLLNDSRALWRLLHGAVLLISTSAIVLSGTRSALLGLGVGGACLIYLLRRNVSARKVIGLLVTIGFVLLLLLTLFTRLPLGRPLRERLAQWSHDSAGGPRLMVWRDSLPLLGRHWLIGMGPEAFAEEFRKVQSLQLARAYPDHYHEAPHNLFLEIAANQGILGLSILLSLLVLAGACGFRKAAKGDAEACVLLVSLVGLVVALEFPPLAFTNVLYLYLFIGLLIALAVPQPPTPSPKSLQFLSASAAVVAVAVAIAYISQDLYFTSTARAIAQGDSDRAWATYSVARKFPFPGQELWCSLRWVALARSQHGSARANSLAHASAASDDAEHSNAEKFDAFYQSAVLALIASHAPRAEAKLRQAIDAAPVWYRPRMMLAALLWHVGRSHEAERQGRLALECGGTHEQEIKLTLERARQ